MNRIGAMVFILCLAITAAARGDDPVAKPRSDGRLQLDSVVLTLIEQVEVSARQTGVLDLSPRPKGKRSKEGDLLASLENNEQRLAVDKARIEAEIAAKQAASDVKIRDARQVVRRGFGRGKTGRRIGGKIQQERVANRGSTNCGSQRNGPRSKPSKPQKTATSPA